MAASLTHEFSVCAVRQSICAGWLSKTPLTELTETASGMPQAPLPGTTPIAEPLISGMPQMAPRVETLVSLFLPPIIEHPIKTRGITHKTRIQSALFHTPEIRGVSILPSFDDTTPDRACPC